MPARTSSINAEIIAALTSNVRVSSIVAELLISGYDAAPTPPVSGISITTVTKEVIIQADSLKGVRVPTVTRETIIAGETAGGSTSSGGGFAFTFAT